MSDRNLISRLSAHLNANRQQYGPNITGAATRNDESVNSSYSHASERPTVFNRYMGGAQRLNQPFISGYHHVWFKLPSALYAQGVESEAAMWLRSTCESFTPHSSTLNMIDVQGIGQIGASFASSKTINREFTLAFREYQNLPILKIIRNWHSIFDQFTGASSLGPGGFIPINYKGWIVVAIMKPTSVQSSGQLDVEDLEEAYIYDGVVPLTTPEDTATASDQASNESVQLSVTFRFDGAPMDLSFPGVGEKVKSLFADDTYYDNYDRFSIVNMST